MRGVFYRFCSFVNQRKTMGIAENIEQIKREIKPEVCLVAVSKTKPNEEILLAYDAGQRVFGENKVQELTAKYDTLPKDIEWHFIGHLQTNKVKYIASFVQLIHGVDSLKLLEIINKEAKKNNRIIDCLLQFHIAEEETKFELDLPEARSLLNDNNFKDLQNIQICGVMGMATYSDDEYQVRTEFRSLFGIFMQLKQEFFSGDASFKELSMGMSGDYLIAIQEGSTLVRVGSGIFGNR